MGYRITPILSVGDLWHLEKGHEGEVVQRQLFKWFRRSLSTTRYKSEILTQNVSCCAEGYLIEGYHIGMIQ